MLESRPPDYWPVVSPFAREHYGRGEREGHLKGEQRQAVEAALDTIDARGLALTDTERERITTCTDLDQLRTWRRRAITAHTTTDIFD
ncbi:hypothetical protein [Actinomadura atramentaria]|uniref:hypothetical protein n=1 Tax=Actinomadura atramentaria TaxID=1990 RepID=UPI0003744B36|nr:hypothetical protein [Actinomadura atramentaria]